MLSYEWDPATLLCRFPDGDSLAYTYMFGSREVGPYYNSSRARRDAYEQPQLRVPAAIQLHAAANDGAPPNCVVYNTIIYELSQLGGKEPASWDDVSAQDALLAMRQHVIDLGRVLGQLRELLPDAVLLLRTTPLAEADSSRRQFRLQAELNAAVRLAARAHGVGVLDWEAMTRGQWRGYLRDSLHPNEAHSAAFASLVRGFCRHAVATKSFGECDKVGHGGSLCKQKVAR